MTLITELPDPGLQVTWYKDNTALSMSEGRYQTVNKDCSYQLVIPKISMADEGEYKVKSGQLESKIDLTIHGEFSRNKIVFVRVFGKLFLTVCQLVEGPIACQNVSFLLLEKQFPHKNPATWKSTYTQDRNDPSVTTKKS